MLRRGPAVDAPSADDRAASVAMVVTAVAVSQADPGPRKAVSVSMLSGGDATPLPAADPALLAPATDPPDAAPESPPTTEASTTTTGRQRPHRAATVAAPDRQALSQARLGHHHASGLPAARARHGRKCPPPLATAGAAHHSPPAPRRAPIRPPPQPAGPADPPARH